MIWLGIMAAYLIIATKRISPEREKHMADSSSPQTLPTPGNRVGLRSGQISELTVIAPLKPGGADRLRALFTDRLQGRFDLADKVGTVHDMRFVFIENDTKLLFATAYDKDWDTYIDDFATKIPEGMDIIFSEVEGWPGIHSPTVKDVIAKYQITASAWYVACPDATVVDIRRGQKVLVAFNNLLDAASQ